MFKVYIPKEGKKGKKGGSFMRQTFTDSIFAFFLIR
jgi:hypothetical protein